MPVAHRDEVELHYESTGAHGAPVLLVMGLGMNATGWWRTVPVLADHFRVLSFDNRGVSDAFSAAVIAALLERDAKAFEREVV